MAVIPAFFGLLMAAVVTGQGVEISLSEAVRKVGEELQVVCRVPYGIDSCRMSVGGTFYRLRPGDVEGDVIYFGRGLSVGKEGECGALIKNIREEWNGNITCVLPPPSGSIEVQATMKLIVAKPPKNQELRAPPQPSFKEGDVFTAQCVAEDSRPAAKISWFLDNEELLAGVHQPIITSLPGSDMKTISQNLSRTLSADDNSRTVVCRVEHEALPSPRDMRRQLVVYYPPKRQDGGLITIFGLKLNEAGRLNVTVRSNPPPRVEWDAGEVRLVGGEEHRTEDGFTAALEPLHLGGGYYNVTLVLSRVTKADVDRSYNLRVVNDYGREDISVRISTMDEPAGVELETGAIVGIVIAVLVFLIALSMGVFAFVTDRWCFAGRRRDNTKSSGESSDTESAVGGTVRSRFAELGARVRAALPHGRDKVQATEAQPDDHDEKEPEDKVVYAQLALSEQTTADKPPPPSTEYAEIVYTDQGQKEAKE